MPIVNGTVVPDCMECENLHRICFRLLWNENMPEEGTRKRARSCKDFYPLHALYELDLDSEERPIPWREKGR